jgi:hypothetical protein
LKPGRLDRRENNDPMFMLAAVAVLALAVWARDLLPELGAIVIAVAFIISVI